MWALSLSCYLWLVDHQPALCARLHVLSTQRLPESDLHFNTTSCGLSTIHHLMRGLKLRTFTGSQVADWGSRLTCNTPSWLLSLTSTISLISLCVSSLSSFRRAVPMGLSLRKKPLWDDTQRQRHHWSPHTVKTYSLFLAPLTWMEVK